MSKTLRIGVDASPMAQLTNGIGRHTYHLIKSLLDLHVDAEFIGFLSPRVSLGQEPAALVESPQLSLLRMGKLGRWWRRDFPNLDLFHGPNFKMVYEGRYGGIVTIHDVWLDRHPEYSKKFFGQRGSFIRTKRTVWKAQCVITVSSHAAQDIEELYGLPRERIVVIPNGVSDDYTQEIPPGVWKALRTKFGIVTTGFILFIGGASPRKNHAMLFKAFSQCQELFGTYSLVCVGRAIDRFGDMRETARLRGITSHVICVEKVSFEELRALYSAADVFVFPSLYEGFGMPVLEAMASGTPVIASRSTALPEVAGDAAILVDPTDDVACADAMIRVLQSSDLRKSLVARGKEQVKMFSWQETARRTFDVYCQICR